VVPVDEKDVVGLELLVIVDSAQRLFFFFLSKVWRCEKRTERMDGCLVGKWVRRW